MKPNIVLLAGGCGTRLWPLSTLKHPKQFITLPHVNISSFQLSLKRSLLITLSEKIIIVANAEYQNLLYQQIYDLGLDYKDFNIILEKYSNNTGIATYFACLLLMQQKREGLTYFWPTDHLIDEDYHFFKEILYNVDQNKINLFGQKVFNPCSNFGYITEGESFSYNYYKVERFIEKPGYKEINILKQNNQKFYRNLGIYLATASVLYNEFHNFYKNLPSVIFDLDCNQHNIQEICSNLPIDKMISERSQLLNFIAIEFGWRDIGSMESLYEYCSGNGLNCKIDPIHINRFNIQNKDFELYCSNGSIQIIKKL